MISYAQVTVADSISQQILLVFLHAKMKRGVRPCAKHMEDMRNEAARIAAERNSMEIALRLMAQEKLTLEETAKGTSFPMEKVQELAKQQTA